MSNSSCNGKAINGLKCPNPRQTPLSGRTDSVSQDRVSSRPNVSQHPSSRSSLVRVQECSQPACCKRMQACKQSQDSVITRRTSMGAASFRSSVINKSRIATVEAMLHRLSINRKCLLGRLLTCKAQSTGIMKLPANWSFQRCERKRLAILSRQVPCSIMLHIRSRTQPWALKCRTTTIRGAALRRRITFLKAQLKRARNQRLTRIPVMSKSTQKLCRSSEYSTINQRRVKTQRKRIKSRERVACPAWRFKSTYLSLGMPLWQPIIVIALEKTLPFSHRQLGTSAWIKAARTKSKWATRCITRIHGWKKCHNLMTCHNFRPFLTVSLNLQLMPIEIALLPTSSPCWCLRT